MTDKSSDRPRKAEPQKLYKSSAATSRQHRQVRESRAPSPTRGKHADKACVVCDDYARRSPRPSSTTRRPRRPCSRRAAVARDLRQPHQGTRELWGQGVGKLNVLHVRRQARSTSGRTCEAAMAAADKEDKATLTKLYDSVRQGAHSPARQVSKGRHRSKRAEARRARKEDRPGLPQ